MDQSPEFFSPTLHADRRYIVAVVNEIRLDTKDPTVTKLYKRGLYSFGNRKSAELFCRTINSNVESEIAFLFDTKGTIS